MSPGKSEGRPGDKAATTRTNDLPTTVTRPGDAWRAGRELGELLGLRLDPVPDDAEEVYVGDWWRTVGMTLGVPERESAGRELLAAGWCA